MIVPMDARAVRFSEVGRALSAAARTGGLDAPAFRSPPRVLHRDRTLLRRPHAGATVAVRLTGRPFGAVVADMVEGVLVANDLTGDDASRWRRELWSAVERATGEVLEAA
jgi:hypothetical protein